KVGELVKGYFLRNRAGVRLASSIPAIMMERVTDVVAVVLVGLIGLALLPVSVRWVLIVVLLLCGLSTWFLVSRHNERLLQLPVLRRWRDEVQLSREGLRSLTALKPIGLAISLGVLAWLSEGLAFWLILYGLDLEVSPIQSLPIYASATVVGAITTLPGGLIGTEGTMLALLQQVGVARDGASAATLLVRLVTLWFAIGIGLIALAILNPNRLLGSGKE
ncbi:MAG TPA: lysylphosphatidylglycerol synthase transmembrane domain-containing protein, partial [Dehalococcoidia bacterium]|nr:lysylphosphatidylglycerol synthase transmembrane domain-containing protein [Dehalococcoidia bacterium]